jgi:hypothetical protein
VSHFDNDLDQHFFGLPEKDYHRVYNTFLIYELFIIRNGVNSSSGSIFVSFKNGLLILVNGNRIRRRDAWGKFDIMLYENVSVLGYGNKFCRVYEGDDCIDCFYDRVLVGGECLL